jgi:hypothetical protein
MLVPSSFFLVFLCLLVPFPLPFASFFILCTFFKLHSTTHPYEYT